MTNSSKKVSRGVGRAVAIAALVVSAACHNGSDRYRVSGVLSGLSAGSVTLALNGAEQIDVAANGRFNFTTLLEPDTLYEVTVVDRPQRTVATVSNGSGTIQGWVMDVGIALEPGYLVGGAVSGLDGDSVQLSLNGGAPITVGANGDFQFSDLLPAGAAYEVALAAEPAGRTVQVDAGSGTMPGSDVATVDVHARSWHHPSGTLDSLSRESGDAFSTRIASNPDGEAVLAFVQNVTGQSGALFIAERSGGQWSHPTQDSDRLNVGPNYVTETDVAINASGDVVLAWVQALQGGNPSVFASVRRSGTWTHPTLVTDALNPVGPAAGSVQVGISDDGRATVVFRQYDGATQHLYLAENQTGTWTRPSSLGDTLDQLGNVSQLDLAVAPSGDACVVYEVLLPGDFGSAAALVKSERRNGAWTHPTGTNDGFQIDSYPDEPLVCVNRNGRMMIAWREWDGTEMRAMASLFTDGTWVHPASFEDALSPGTTSVWEIAATIDDDGACDLFFCTWTGTEDAVFGAHLGGDGTWTLPVGLEDRLSPQSVSVDSICCASSPSGHVVLCAYDDNTSTLYTSECVRGVWAFGTTAMNLPNHEAYDLPALAFDARGNLFAAHVDVAVLTLGSTTLRQFVSEYR